MVVGKALRADASQKKSEAHLVGAGLIPVVEASAYPHSSSARTTGVGPSGYINVSNYTREHKSENVKLSRNKCQSYKNCAEVGLGLR